MATLNEMIAQGAQFNVPDPTAQYNKLAQMQKYQQENELAKMQMEEYGRARQESNALRQFLPGLNESNRSQLLGYGAAGQGVYKMLGEGETQRRLAEQASSQANLNESSILKNAVAQTRDAVAGIDPNDVESYAALRTSVLTQYPKLAPYMPAAWDASVKQRLITTAASVLEGQKPNIAPIDVSKFTPESLQAYLNSKNPASLVAVAPKPVNPYAPIDPAKYTQGSLEAYGLSGKVSDLVPLPAKAANAFAPINVKDFTPESVKAFVASQNPADLVAAPSKAVSPFAPINVKDYTPESLEAYGLSGKVSDLLPVPAKADKPVSLINQIDASKFTPASVSRFATSQNYADLEPVATKADKPASLVNQIDASKFTPSSVAAFSTGGDYSLLVPVVSATKADRTIANVNPNDFTPKSLDKYLISSKYADLVPVAKSSGGEGAGGAAGTGTVEVVDPKDRTKTIIVTKARAVAEGLTPAKAIEGLTPKMKQQLEADYPKATLSLRSYQSKSAAFIKDIEELRDSEGLDSVTGIVAGRAPGITDAGRAAVALYNKIVAKGGFQSLQDMRDMSKTGGALGNTSNRDISLLIDAFAAIDRKQSASDVKKALNNLINELKGSQERIKDAYDLTYEYRNLNAAPAAAVTPSAGFGRATVIGR